MKSTLLALLGFILLSTPRAATAQQSDDFYYESDGSEITITGYTGPGGDVTIPSYLYEDACGCSRPVKHIGDGAFYFSDPNWTNYPTRNYRIRSP